MVKVTRFFVIFVLINALNYTASASPFSFGFKLYGSMPVGDFSKIAELGRGANIFAEFPIAGNSFKFYLESGIVNWPSSEQYSLSENVLAYNVTYYGIPLQLGLTYYNSKHFFYTQLLSGVFHFRMKTTITKKEFKNINPTTGEPIFEEVTSVYNEGRNRLGIAPVFGVRGPIGRLILDTSFRYQFIYDKGGNLNSFWFCVGIIF